MPRQRKDGEQTRQIVLGAAQSVFAAQGFAGASIKAIAEKSGVSQSLVLHHFKGGKPELWAEIKRAAVSRFAANFPSFEEDVQTNAQLVREVFYAYFCFCVEHPELMKIGLWVRVTEGPSEDWGGEAEVLSRLAVFATDAQSNGFVRDDVPVFDLMMIFSGAVKSWVFDGQHFLNASGTQTNRQDIDEAFFESAFRTVAIL